MAKKKTENIKAVPVLRVQGGDQSTPTPEQTRTKTYQIMDPWKDRDVVNLVDVKAVDGEITEVKVNGQPAGGGGGDPETVNIKIRNSSSHPVIVSTMINYNELTASRRISNNSTETLRVVMFTDEMPFTFTTTDGGSISSTSTFGTVTFNNAYSGYITQGDTITIASA